MVKSLAHLTDKAVSKIMAVVMGIAFAAAIVVVLMTLVDIGLRNIDRVLGLFSGQKSGWAILGLVDITQLFTMIAASLAIAVAFYRGAHVSVDLLTSKFSACGLWGVAIFAALLNLGFTCGCLWAGWRAMQMDLETATSSSTIAIPYLAFWCPMLSGFVLSFIGITSRLMTELFPGAIAEQAKNEVLDYV